MSAENAEQIADWNGQLGQRWATLQREIDGIVVLSFAGGGALRFDVECIDAWLSDLSAPWSTKLRPDHGTGADDVTG